MQTSPYDEGVIAAMGDYPNNRAPSNPYPKYSVEYCDWASGYSDGWQRAYMNHRWSGHKSK